MSGARVASYQISQAELAHQREAARQQQVRRDWAVLQRERAAVRRQAAEVAGRYGLAVPHSAGLVDLTKLDEATVQRLTAAARAETALLRGEISGLVSEGRAKVASQHVAGIGPARTALRVGSVPQPVAVPAPRTVDAADPATVEADVRKRLGRLAPGILPTPHIDDLAAQLMQAPAAQWPVLLGALRDEVERANADAAQRHTTEVLVLRAEVVAEETRDRPLAALADAARCRVAAGESIDAAALRAAMDAAESRQAAEAERAFVRRNVVQAFQKLGYHVVSTPTINTPEGGMLVQHRDNGSLGLAISVAGGAIDVEPVELVDVGRAGTARRDTRTEEQMCVDTASVWDDLADTGINVGRVRPRGPATAPPKPLGVRVAAPAMQTRWASPVVADEQDVEIEQERAR